jgi:uncharacterized SAM-binding protein YcdF (DUF218 family)
MFQIISKLASLIYDPVGLTLLILAASIFFVFFLRRTKIAVFFLICGFLSLLIFGSPAVSRLLMRGLESQYQPLHYYDPASAVVLLGGGTVGKIPPRIHVETNHAANRVIHAVRVFRQSESLRLVLTGGLLEWTTDESVPEARSIFELVNEMFRIKESDVILEDRSKNTRENAVFTKEAMENAGLGNDIILVTSAYHMPRSVAVFKKAGFEVTPAPTGYFKNSFASGKILTWLPNSSNLFDSSIALREYWGMMVYKMVGWI